MRHTWSRREFLETAAAGAAGLAAARSTAAAAPAPARAGVVSVSVFRSICSISTTRAGRDDREAGFGGIDLTVAKAARAAERVREDLPKAVDARARRLAVP